MNNFKIIDETLVDYIGLDENVVVPEGVETISSDAFAGNEYLESIVLPESIKVIQPRSFKNCINLHSVTLPDKSIFVHEDVFDGCEKLIDKKGFIILNKVLYKYTGIERRVVVPKGVKKIGSAAFLGNCFIEEVVLPDSVEFVDFWSFSDCSNLRSIKCGPSLVKFAEEAFSYSYNLANEKGFFVLNGILINYFGEEEDVLIPEYIKRINMFAFEDGCRVHTVRIPKTVEKIDGSAFISCEDLKYLIFEDHETLVNNLSTLRYVRATMISRTELGINRLDMRENKFNYFDHQEDDDEVVVAYS